MLSMSVKEYCNLYLFSVQIIYIVFFSFGI